MSLHVGIDIGGTKLAAIALAGDGTELARLRRAIERDPSRTDRQIGEVVAALEADRSRASSVGLSVPGMIGADGTVKRAVNLPWLEGRRLGADLGAALARPVAVANDANCFALSEARAGAATGARVVFGVTLGTGVGGGLVVDGRVLAGANALAGEWGHVPLPWTRPDDGPPPQCGCGRSGCIEAWLNGAALGDGPAAMARYCDRLARALASLINIVDPDVIVLGGGLSDLPELYDEVPRLWGRYALASVPETRLVKAKNGADSGMIGAAWLGADAAR